MSTNQISQSTLKSKVLEHITVFMNEDEIKDHNENTDNTLDSQKEFLKRSIVERSDNPLNEIDSLHVVEELDENTICPFINGHLARDF